MNRRKGILLAAAAMLALVLSAAAVPAGSFSQTGAGQKSVKVSWSNPEDEYNIKVRSYQLQWGKSSSSLTHTKTLSASERSSVITGLKPYSRYFVKVMCTYANAYGSIYTDQYSSMYVGTAPGKVSKIKYDFCSNQKGFRIAWTKPSGDGYGANYQVMLRDLNKKTIRNVKTSSTYSFSNTCFIKKVCKAQIRAFLEINGKKYYGPWTYKSVVPQPIISLDKTKTYIRNGKLTLRWSKVYGAQKYSIFVSKKPDSGFRCVRTVKGNVLGTTLSKFGTESYKNNTYYYVQIVTRSAIGSAVRNYGAKVRLSVY